jgi:hypothetical protein
LAASLGLLLATAAGGSAGGDGSPIFTDESPAAGLDFTHFNGMRGELFFPEIMGAGGALFDYDDDGDLDLFLCQGSELPQLSDRSQTLRPAPRAPGGRLYRNDLAVGSGGEPLLRFTDVTEVVGLESLGYGMGVAVGDYDNDGFSDLYVTNHGPNQLWRNRGDGTFVDVTEATATGDDGWGIAALFADFDRDGRLDLYVGNYVDASPANHRICHVDSTAPTYCSPSLFPPQRDRLFMGQADGRFRDASSTLGDFGPALGAIAADFDGDGRIDLYVANDGTPNLLWMNRGSDGFVDQALLAGAALSADGLPEASMGVDAADFDGDGDEDIFVTHLDRETNTLYVNDGRGMFDDRTATFALAAPSRRMTGFGTSWIDYDNDGDLDLLVVNGEVDTIEEQHRTGSDFPFAQANQLFRREPSGLYRDVSQLAGPAFTLLEVSRAAIFGDVDNDGDTDVVVTNNSGPARLLVNRVGSSHAWLGLRLVTASGRDALGARVVLDRHDAPALWRRVRTGGSYASANDPRVLFGLGENAKLERAVVIWPSGRREEWRELPLRRYTRLEEGSGSPLSSPLE